jgi:hypothetical protein
VYITIQCEAVSVMRTLPILRTSLITRSRFIKRFSTLTPATRILQSHWKHCSYNETIAKNSAVTSVAGL